MRVPTAEALHAALALVRRLASCDAASIAEVLLVWLADRLPAPLVEVADAAGFPERDRALERRIAEADGCFRRAFATSLIEVRDTVGPVAPPAPEGEAMDRWSAARRGFEEGVDLLAGPRATVAEGFARMLGTAPIPIAPDDGCVPDRATGTWVRAACAAAAAGAGHHFLLSGDEAGTQARLFATMAAAHHRPVYLEDGDDPIGALLLRCELHVGDATPLVVVGTGKLVGDDPAPGEWVDDDWRDANGRTPPHPTAALRASADDALPCFGRLRAVYVWHVGSGAVPRSLCGAAAGRIGPVAIDGASALAQVAAAAPGLSPAAASALLAVAGDPRAIGPSLAATSAVAAGAGMTPDAAALFVARSHGVRVAPAADDRRFDPMLPLADEDVGVLLARAGELAARGARVLLWGPPAGGKSRLAEALCAAMVAARPALPAAVSGGVVRLTAASLLAHRWGDMERRLEAAFFEAAAGTEATGAAAPILVDELDAFCPVREQGGRTSNNGHLARSLTDEWLRNLDAHPGVPVVATVNDLLCVDAPARRRFHFVISVAADLDPERELRAWTTILGVAPPPGWHAVGAAIGDFASAAQRCGMLGLGEDAEALAAAVGRARDARLGLLGTKGGLRPKAVH